MRMTQKKGPDWPLLEIKRQYSHDEAVKALEQEISRLNFRIGEQKSEIDELRYKLNTRAKTGKVVEVIIEEGTKKTKKAWSREEIVHQYEQEVATLQASNQRLQKEVSEWRNNYCNLLARTEKEKRSTGETFVK